MKAIQVKFLNCTNTKPSRLKVIVEGYKPFIYSVDSFDTNNGKSAYQQAAEKFANHFNWLKYNNWTECERVLRGGNITALIQVFVVVEIPYSVRKSFIEFEEV